MPSPFPGMDPYLEDARYWAGWHSTFIPYLMVDLNKLLLPRYIANVNERLYLEEPDRDIFPDIDVKNRGPAGNGNGTALRHSQAEDPPVLLEMDPEDHRETYIDVVATAEPGRVITTIELLSPTNKLAGSTGRRKYRDKQREILAGPIHLLEIDLLRRGEHTVVAPIERLRPHHAFHYVVSLSRGNQRQVCEVWPIPLAKRLPRIRVPVRAGEPDVVFDLQSTFDRCYDEASYQYRLDYGAATDLAAPDAAWADALLREKGIRR